MLHILNWQKLGSITLIIIIIIISQTYKKTVDCTIMTRECSLTRARFWLKHFNSAVPGTSKH